MNSGGPRLAVALLTVIPAGYRGTPGRRDAGAAMTWAPAVGLVLGALACVPLLLRHALGPSSAAVLAVAVLAALTRGLHLDGLADLADGLGSGKPAAGALEVMRRSDIGPFGVITLVLTLVLQVTTLAHAAHPGFALLAAAVTGRLALTWACRAGVPAARPDGLGALVAATVPVRRAWLVTGACLAAVACLAWWRGTGPGLPLGVLAGCFAGLLVGWHAVRRLGGITGDVLGAVEEVAVTVCVVVAAL